MTDGPDLSVVVVTAGRFDQVRRTVRHLHDQTGRGRMELILVASDDEAVADATAGELDGFWAVRVVAVGPIPNVDVASASGIRAARAPVVSVIEDHAFVQPGWASAIVAAHEAPVAMVGSVMVNANPRHVLSWVNLLLAYGAWTDPRRAGPVTSCASHNFTCKRDLLLAAGDELESLLGRGGTLMEELAEVGQTFVLDAEARIAHVNPSRWSSTADLRFSAGRLYGAMRAAGNGWGRTRRLIYMTLGPLIPAVRFVRVWREHFAGGRWPALRPRIYPALAVVLAIDGAGQVVGYAAGAGTTAEKLATFEMDRRRHVRADDRPLLDEPPPEDVAP